MKKEIKGFICGIIATSLIGCVSISATGIWDNIDVLRNDINVVVNGTPVQADNFLYNDTTYLPMRIVAEALGKDVQYDETTNTATIKDKGDNNLSENLEIKSKYKLTEELAEPSVQAAFIRVVDGYYYICRKAIEEFFNVDCVADNSNIIITLPDGSVKMFAYTVIDEAPFMPYDTFMEQVYPLIQ